MLQDQDRLEDWNDEVSVQFNKNYGVMEAEAWRKCKDLLSGDELSEVIGVEQRTTTPNQSGNVKWTCKFRTERRDTPDVNDN